MTTFYVAADGNDSNPGTRSLPWLTSGRVNTLMADGTIKRGNSVLFKRGDEFFGAINPAPAGAAYGPQLRFGAYGEGPRPKLSGYKIMNSSGDWTLHAANVWKIDLTANSGAYTGNVASTSLNVGHLRIDGDVWGGRKSALASLGAQWDFYSDNTQFLYVYSTANPTTLAADVRVSASTNCLTPRNATAFDGLEITGFAGHGASIQNDNTVVLNVSITDCDINHVGGGYQPSTANRYGNGIEVWIGGNDISITGNLIHDAYDTGTTLQGPVNAGALGWNGVSIRHNTIWNCTQSFEVWATGVAPTGGFKKVLFAENICLDGGNSWGEQWRQDPTGNSCQLLAYSMELPTDIVVENNIFWQAHDNYLYTSSPLPAGYISRNNTIGLTAGQKMQAQRAETIEQAEDWRDATGYEQGSVFLRVPASISGHSDALAYLASHAATAPVMAKIAARAAGSTRGDLAGIKAIVDKLDTPIPIGATPLRPSNFYVAPFISDAVAGGANGEAIGVIFHPGRAARISTIAFEVIGAGSAGAVVRAGVYTYSDSSSPRFTLTQDGGTTAVTTTGVKTITVATDPPPGATVLIMLAIQGAPATLPTLRMVNVASPALVGHSTATAALASTAGGVKATMAGAFPADLFLSSLSPAAAAYKVAIGVPASS